MNNPSLLPFLTDERETTTDQRSHPWFLCQPRAVDVVLNACNWQCQALHLLQPSPGRITRNTRSARLRPPGTGCSHIGETLACYLLRAISEILTEHFVVFWLVVFSESNTSHYQDCNNDLSLPVY